MAIALPIIDLAQARNSPEDLAATVAQIAASNRKWGFFYVVNHGIPAQVPAEQLGWAEHFFALPDAETTTVDLRQLPVERGYEPMASQMLQDGAQPDQKEGFSFGREPAAGEDANVAPSEFECPNQWPGSFAGFDGAAIRAQMETYRKTMGELGARLCGLLAEAFDLGPNHFADALADLSIFVRLLHYPPSQTPERVGAPTDHLGCGAHTDRGLITILLQDDCDSLEILAGGEWIEATPIEGPFIVNLGDMVVRMTQGHFASTSHRVINREPTRHCYSAATFFQPARLLHGRRLAALRRGGRSAAPIRFNDRIRAMMEKTYGTGVAA